MQIDKKQRVNFLTFIWPFGGLAYSVFNWRNVEIKNAIWIFCIFFGSVFIYSFSESSDAYRYFLRLEDMANYSTSEVFSSFYQEKGALDLYVSLISLLLSRITTNGHILFTVYATIFGYFYSRNISYVIKFLNKKNSRYFGVLLVFYVLINPIWNINIVRFFTAAHVFAYGLMPYIIENKKSKIVFVFISIFFHWSFIFPVIVYIVWNYLPKKTHLFFAFYLITLFINTINLELFDLQSLGVLGHRIGLYAKQSAIDTYTMNVEQVGWHVKLSNTITDIIIQLFIFILYFVQKKHFSTNKPFIRLFTFSLLIYAISNLLQVLNFPEAYRFVTLSLMFLLPSIIFSISNINRKASRQALATLSIPIIFTIIFKIRVGMDYFGVSLLIGNFLSSIIVEDVTPLISFVKEIF